jgi:hypothetical protein
MSKSRVLFHLISVTSRLVVSLPLALFVAIRCGRFLPDIGPHLNIHSLVDTPQLHHDRILATLFYMSYRRTITQIDVFVVLPRMPRTD